MNLSAHLGRPQPPKPPIRPPGPPTSSFEGWCESLGWLRVSIVWKYAADQRRYTSTLCVSLPLSVYLDTIFARSSALFRLRASICGDPWFGERQSRIVTRTRLVLYAICSLRRRNALALVGYPSFYLFVGATRGSRDEIAGVTQIPSGYFFGCFILGRSRG